MGTSVVRPLAVAHGGYSNPLQLRDSCKQGAERRPDRQRGKRCTVGSPHQNLNDVVAEKPQRCTVGSQIVMVCVLGCSGPGWGGGSDASFLGPAISAASGVGSSTLMIGLGGSAHLLAWV